MKRLFRIFYYCMEEITPYLQYIRLSFESIPKSYLRRIYIIFFILLIITFQIL